VGIIEGKNMLGKTLNERGRRWVSGQEKFIKTLK
jgi:hypothetical protein